MKQIRHHRKIRVLDPGIPPSKGSLLSPGLPDPQMTTLERKWKFLCPGSATNLLCDLSKIISRPWVSFSFLICTLKALGSMIFRV